MYLHTSIVALFLLIAISISIWTGNTLTMITAIARFERTHSVSRVEAMVALFKHINYAEKGALETFHGKMAITQSYNKIFSSMLDMSKTKSNAEFARILEDTFAEADHRTAVIIVNRMKVLYWHPLVKELVGYAVVANAAGEKNKALVPRVLSTKNEKERRMLLSEIDKSEKIFVFCETSFSRRCSDLAIEISTYMGYLSIILLVLSVGFTGLLSYMIAKTVFQQATKHTSNLEREIQERKHAEDALRESEKEATRMAQENELIADIGRIISSTLNIEEVYEFFADKVETVIPFDRISINIANFENNTRTITYVKGDKFSGGGNGEVYPLAGTAIDKVMFTKASLLINSKNRESVMKDFPPESSRMFSAQSSIIIPIISRKEVIGALAIHSGQKDAYSEHKLKFAERIGTQIAGTIANAQLYRERTRAEEEKKDLSERLQRSEKMESLGTLAGGVAHDLNNVLGVLSGYSEILVEQLPEGNNLKKYAASILKSSEKGAAIIQDLLTLARRGVVVDTVVGLNNILSGYLASPEFDKLKTYHPQVTIKTDLEQDLLNVKGSPVHLEKTIMNLVTNAAEAIHGDGEVIIRTENRYVDHAISGYDQVEPGDYAVLTISDTGGGISATDLAKIFEPFYTKKSMGRSGTGLGLAIVWGTVKDHNGCIDVQSIEGKGTTFTLYFPVTRQDIADVMQKVPVEQYLGQGESVLVVDDVQEQRQVATTILTQLGYKVNSVSSGREAIAYLQSNKVDMLVLDMIMDPGIDGLDAYKLILDTNPHQKAIIVSGFSETERVRDALRLGAGGYVKKPYLKEKIGVAIRDELARK